MATQLPHYLRPPEEWTAENVTARDLVIWRDIVVSAFCEGCRVTREMNVWRIGARLADDHLQELRFRCTTCGVYPSVIEISRRDSMTGQKLLMVPLKPRAWDEGHREDQARAPQPAAPPNAALFPPPRPRALWVGFIADNGTGKSQGRTG